MDPLNEKEKKNHIKHLHVQFIWYNDPAQNIVEANDPFRNIHHFKPYYINLLSFTITIKLLQHFCY